MQVALTFCDKTMRPMGKRMHVTAHNAYVEVVATYFVHVKVRSNIQGFESEKQYTRVHRSPTCAKSVYVNKST